MTRTERRIFLDYNAGAPLLPNAREAILAALDLAGNPSSVHREGRAAKALLEASRRAVAALAGATAENVVFTSGASEGASMCLTPNWVSGGEALALEALAVAETDHPATRGGGRFPVETVERLAVDRDGRLPPEALERWVARQDGRPAMLCLSLANSETGVVQDMDFVRRCLRDTRILLVLDAVQAAGRLPLRIDDLGADALILSSHKIGGGKGAGAVVFAREGVRPLPLVTGGGQERGLRAGTEALPAIAGFAAAARAAVDGLHRLPSLAAMRDRLEARLVEAAPDLVIFGKGAPRLANTSALAAPGLKAETAQIALDLQGFAVSAGSACSSGKVGASHVAAALAGAGLAIDPTNGAIRMSCGPATSEADLDAFAETFSALLRRREQSATVRDAA